MTRQSLAPTSTGGCPGKQLIDAIARRPAGWIGRCLYGGACGAPPGHEAVFDQVLDWLGPLQGDRCLEVGCGGGRLLERVLARGAASAAGLDYSPDMLALTIVRNREAVAGDALRVKLGDAARIPWPDRAFTATITANMFLFVEKPQEVLAELFRVLAPGGRLVIATIPGPLPPPSLRQWWVYVLGPAIYAYTDEEMRMMYERAGFTDIRVQSKAEDLQLSRGSRPRLDGHQDG